LFGGDSLAPVENHEYLTGEFTYSGEMKFGHFNGNGTIDFQNGERLAGNFTDGRLDGQGVFYSNNEQPDSWRFAGLFEDGSIISGTIYRGGETIGYVPGADADALIGHNWQYDGFFGISGQSGTGVFTFDDGSVYSGGFVNGFADGEGTYTDPVGRVIYTGGFTAGLFDGPGSYFSTDGWSYEGSFRDGKFDGQGVIITDSVTIRGVWAEGVQIERHE